MAAALLLGASTLTGASAHASELLDGLTLSYGSRLYVIEAMSNESAAGFNPDNYVAELPRARGVALGLIDLKLEWKSLTLTFEPRGLIDTSYRSVQENSDVIVVGELYLQEAVLSWEHDAGVKIAAGRFFYDVGPSVFFAPSNPFAAGSARLNPKIDPPSRDFATVTYVGETGWSIGAMANLLRGRDTLYEEPFLEFVRSYALRAEVAGERSTTFVIASLAEDLQGQLGGSFQMNLSESVLGWFDASLSYGHRSFLPERDDDAPSGWEMVSRGEDRNFYPVGLAGGSYSLRSGMSFSLEYLYNGAGYDDEQATRFYEMADELSGITLFPVTDHARRNRARGINTGLSFLRQHYAMVEVRQIDLFDVLNFSLRGIVGIQDASGQASALVEWTATDEIEVFLVALVNAGKRDSEYGRFLQRSVMAGVEIRL